MKLPPGGRALCLSLLLSGIVIPNAAGQERWRDVPELGKYFGEYGVKGAFVLYDMKNDSTLYYNRERIAQEFIPASTFKIPNTLIALETGVATDENFKIPWDGTDYRTEAWNRDQTLKTAFAYSVVWYYQELARRIGTERMRRFVDTLRYGNRNIGGGIDRFWLDGDLRISPLGQIDFLRRMYSSRLPVSKRSVDILKKIMVLEKTPEYTLSAKTGMAVRTTVMIGWLVGFLERGGNIYVFATNIEQKDAGDVFGASRLEITRKIFKHLRLM